MHIDLSMMQVFFVEDAKTAKTLLIAVIAKVCNVKTSMATDLNLNIL